MKVSWFRGFAILFALVLASCGARKATDQGPSASETPGSIENVPQPEDLGWREPSDRWLVDPASGLMIALPEGWLLREGGGDLLFEARHPSEEAFFRMRRWDGWTDSLLALHQPAEGAFLHQGPYSGLDRVSDELPFVGSRPPEGEGGLLFGWYFAVDGHGLELEAELPQDSFEARWREVDASIRSAKRSRGKELGKDRSQATLQPESGVAR